MSEQEAGLVIDLLWLLVYGVFLRTEAGELFTDLASWALEQFDRHILGEED